MTARVPVKKKVLNENDRLAADLRQLFADHGIFAVNLISSPGSGKTALLEKTLASYAPGSRVAVLTGDIQTDADAQRLARYGFPTRQITTAGACHLDASMIRRALDHWDLSTIDTLFIENVGNLVCPTSFDLGEHAKIVVEAMGDGSGAVMINGKMEDDASCKQCLVMLDLAKALAERDPDLAELYEL